MFCVDLYYLQHYFVIKVSVNKWCSGFYSLFYWTKYNMGGGGEETTLESDVFEENVHIKIAKILGVCRF